MNDSSSQLEQLFLAAYEEHADAVYRFCLAKVSNREQAEDLSQEAFTRTWDYARKGQGTIDNWKAFVFRTANNLIIDYYRKKKSSSLDEMSETVGFVPIDHHTLPQDKHAEYVRAREALQTLDEAYREPVYLRIVEDLSPRDIAQILNISENVASVRINRGIKKLQQLLHTV